MSGVAGKLDSMFNTDTVKTVLIDSAVIYAVSKFVVKKEMSFTDAIFYGAGVEIGTRLLGGVL